MKIRVCVHYGNGWMKLHGPSNSSIHHNRTLKIDALNPNKIKYNQTLNREDTQPHKMEKLYRQAYLLSMRVRVTPLYRFVVDFISIVTWYGLSMVFEINFNFQTIHELQNVFGG